MRSSYVDRRIRTQHYASAPRQKTVEMYGDVGIAEQQKVTDLFQCCRQIYHWLGR